MIIKKNNKPTLSIDQSIDIFSQENLEKFKTFFKEYLYSKNYSRIKYYIDVYKNENYINNAINDSFKKIKESSEFLNIINFNSQQEIQQEFINICEKNINLFCIELSKKLNWNYNFVYMIFNDQISDEKFIEVNDVYNNMISVEYNKNLYINNLSVQNEKISWLKERSKTESSDLENMAYEYAKKEVEEYKNNSSIFQEALLINNKIISCKKTKEKHIIFYKFKNINESLLKNINGNSDLWNDVSIINEWIQNNEKVYDLLFEKVIDYKGTKINFISFILKLKDIDSKGIYDNLNELIMIFKNIIQYVTGREYNSFKSIAAGIYSLDLITIREPLFRIYESIKNIEWISESFKEIVNIIHSVVKYLIIGADVIWNPYSFSIILGGSYVVCWPLFSFLNSIINGPSFDYNNILNVVGGVFNLAIGSIFQIVLNPLLNTTELIIFCQENNITFW